MSSRPFRVTDEDAAYDLMYGVMGGEYDYMRGCALAAEGRYYSARMAFEVSGFGDWEERAQACIQPWPETGELYSNSEVYGDITALCVVFNGTPDTAMLVKIYTVDGVLARTMFIGGSGSATTYLPEGVYIIKDGAGEEWYGEQEAFGADGYYEIMTFDDDVQEVLLEGYYITTITVNVQESNPDGKGVGSDAETWENF